ncbi:hypothetical protein COLO4_35386 [Corchorus olitorius]|uniref:RNase H type-1 domain-containing protein n=1 Tax=Corchorus olitorius TaxID=93759 RepID=A0A1R3GHA2_9ROSI|nr:hypothetical protein COLO4_35386 [Corchorus olitorius]
MEERVVNIEEKGTFCFPVLGDEIENGSPTSPARDRDKECGGQARGKSLLAEPTNQEFGRVSLVSNNLGKKNRCKNLGNGFSVSDVERPVFEEHVENLQSLNEKMPSSCADYSGMSVESFGTTGEKNLSGSKGHKENCEFEEVELNDLALAKGATSLSDSSIIQEDNVVNPISLKDDLCGSNSFGENPDLGGAVLYHVEVGLVSYFKSMNIKRNFEDVFGQSESSSKRVWIERLEGASLKIISEESNTTELMEGVQRSEDVVTERAKRVFVGRRKRCGRLKEVIFAANRAAGEVINAKEFRRVVTKLSQKSNSIVSWEKPEPVGFKINCDEAFDASTSNAAIGLVVRDEHGVLKEGIAKVVSILSSIEVEAIAVKEAVSLAMKLHPSSIIIETDSKMVQKSAQNFPKEMVRDWRILPIFSDISASLENMNIVQLKWINRKANMATNWVATNTRKGICSSDWALRPPSQLLHIFDKDGVSAPL